jgi:hypothetical protein
MTPRHPAGWIPVPTKCLNPFGHRWMSPDGLSLTERDIFFRESDGIPSTLSHMMDDYGRWNPTSSRQPAVEQQQAPAEMNPPRHSERIMQPVINQDNVYRNRPPVKFW